VLRQFWDRFLALITRIVPSNFFDAEMGQWAVIVIDMQKCYLKGIHPDDRREIIENQLKIIEYCRLGDIPVVILEYKGDGKTIGKIKEAVQGVPRARYLTKSRNNGFSGTGLAEILHDWGIKNVLLMGINASYCVKETAKGALEAGFRIATSGALITNRKKERRVKSASWFARNGAYAKGFPKIS
jgi:nicotinamidase-related amidase